MGKLSSIILGTIGVLAVSYYFLSSAFSPVTSWFGPLIGYKLTLLLGLMYLFAGNPFHHPVLILAWALIGFVIAISSRRILRAILSAMVVYTLSLVFAVMAVASLLFQFIPSSLPGAVSSPTVPATGGFPTISLLPPTPPGSDIISVLNEPVIGTFINSVLSALSSQSSRLATGSGPASLTDRLSFLDPLILHIVENSIIFIFLAGLLAYLIREGIGRLGTRGRETGVAQKAVALFIVAIILISFLLSHTVAGPAGSPSISDMLKTDGIHAGPGKANSSTGVSDSTGYLSYLNELSGLLSGYCGYGLLPQFHASSGTPSHVGASVTDTVNLSNTSAGTRYSYITWSKESYVEINAAFASKSGNSNDLYLFAKGTGQPANTNRSQWYSSSPVADSVFTAVIGSSGLPNFFINSNFPSLSAGGFSPGFAYSNLIPSLLIVEVFRGNLTSTGGGANSEIIFLSHTMHITPPTLALDMERNVSVNGSAANVSIYLYGGAYNFTKISAGYADGMVSGFQSTGLIVPFISTMHSGYSIPSATPDSVNGSLILAAYASPAGLALLPDQANSFFRNSTGSPGIALLAGLSVRNTVFNFSQTGNISLSSLTGYSRSIYFDAESNLSVLAIGAPSSVTSTSTGAAFSGVGFKIYTSNVSYGGQFGVAPQNSSDIYFINGSGIDPGNISIHASAAFPADLGVRTSVLREGGYEKVSTVIYNRGTESISNLVVNESSLLEYYGNHIAVMSGAPDGSYQSLSPQQSVTLSYRIELNGVGLYLLPPLVSVSYQLMQKNFNMSYSPSKYFSVGNPDIFYASNGVIESFLHGASRFVAPFRILSQPVAGDFYVFDVIIILFFILAFYIECRAFVKWKNARKPVE